MQYTEKETREALLAAALRMQGNCGLTDAELLARLLELSKDENIETITRLLNLMSTPPEE
ncbi:MAG: hypothetical protein J6D21_09765 [Clostridia bacterium]|nr:hypothetical protein [Clostridia bacterium]